MSDLRQFEGGATRSSANGKIDWHGVYNVLVEQSFGRYMKRHTKTEDGGTREFDNWHSGWDRKISLQSLIRHVKDLEACYDGYLVVKVRNKDGEETYYLREGEEVNIEEGDIVEYPTEEDCVNAARFNCGSYILNLLTAK